MDMFPAFEKHAVMMMGDVMGEIPRNDETQIVKRIVRAAKVHSCFHDMRTLPSGSDEWMERVRRGCTDAREAPLVEIGTRALGVALNLCRLSWEIQGGSTLPLEVMPYIDELGKLQAGCDTKLAPFAVDLVVAFFTGVAARLCDISHLDSIGPSLASWHLSSDAVASVADHTLIASCELKAVRLLAAPTRRGSLWLRNKSLFVAEITRVLVALQSCIGSDSVEGVAAFLASQVIVKWNELVPELVSAAAGSDHSELARDVAREANDLATQLREGRPTNMLVHAALAALDSKPMPDGLTYTPFLPARASRVLAAFRVERLKNNSFVRVDDSLWSKWLNHLLEAEDFCRLATRPTHRSSIPGFWMYRDRQITEMQFFGEAFTDRQPQIDLDAALDRAPNLRSVVCGTTQISSLWPHVVINTRI